MIQRLFQISCVSLCLLSSSISFSDTASNKDRISDPPENNKILHIRDWAKPVTPADPAFRDVAVGLDHSPMSYSVTVEPGASYVVALGFCESHWDKPGQRLVDISIDGKHQATVDAIADAGGRNNPFVVKIPVLDSDKDGLIIISIRAAYSSPDVNSILNVLWVFKGTETKSIDNTALIRGDLNEMAYVYLPAGRRKDDPGDAHFQIMGRRCVAYLNPESDSAGSVAFAITEGLATLQIGLDDSTVTKTVIHDNWLEGSYHLLSSVQARSSWYASIDKPAFIVSFEITNPTDKILSTKLNCRMRPNPGYFNKFAVQENDLAETNDGVVTVTDSIFPHIKVCAGIFPSPEKTTVTGAGAYIPGRIAISMERVIELPPKTTRSYCLVVVGGDGKDPKYSNLHQLIRTISKNPEVELNLVKKTAREWSDDRLIIQTPDAKINEYIRRAKEWAFKDTRVLPFGKPYNVADSTLNERIPVLTASPVYHGVFANDNIQSIWEWGALGSKFYPVLENSLDVMLGFDIPESVEWMAGDRSIFMSGLKIGQHAEWVTGACYLMLWSSRKEYQKKYWTKVKELLERYHSDFDRDHDFLDDYSSSPFPEHPNPGTYNHEMLYASAFWYKAFEYASAVAGMIGDVENAHQYTNVAQSIRKAINAKFGSSWGYAGWLDSQHNQHRHINHNSVLPLQYGISTDYIAEKVLKSIFSPESMTKWGPLHMDSKNGITGSQLVWAFQRWNLVHALFETGRTDQALDLMVKWIDQESSFDILYGAPEAFAPDGKVTTLGYSWTAGRAVRAYLFGLFGLQLLPDGFTMHPRMPSAWSNMSLHKLEIRGTLFDIDVKRADAFKVAVDGQEISGSNISRRWFDGKHHKVVIEYNE